MTKDFPLLGKPLSCCRYRCLFEVRFREGLFLSFRNFWAVLNKNNVKLFKEANFHAADG